jgi:integrase
LDIPAHVIEMLERRRRAQAHEPEPARGSDFVFHSASGRPKGPQDVHRALRLVREWAQLPASYAPHALRRSVGTQVADALGLEAAAMLLGHQRSRVTEQYYAKRQRHAPDTTGVLSDLHARVSPREA